MNPKICCFTGHRRLPADKIPKIKKDLEKEVKSLINQGVCKFICGGALGFDTIAAQTVLELRPIYPNIKLILNLPCRNQAEKWREEDLEIYESIKKQADEVIYVSEKYHSGCMIKRNKHMVNCSDCLIAAWDGSLRSGTFSTINHAKNSNKEIIILDLQ